MSRVLEEARRTGETVLLGSVCTFEAVGDAGLALAGCVIEVLACFAPDRVPSNRVVEVEVVAGLWFAALVGVSRQTGLAAFDAAGQRLLAGVACEAVVEVADFADCG